VTVTNRFSRPLVVTRDGELRDELLRLCAAAAVTPDVVGDAALARRDWLVASCVLVGADCAGELTALGMPRRADVSLVAHPPETTQLWRDAVALRADRVVVVPDFEAALVDRLADTLDGNQEPARTVAVIGARGGAGASTFAAALGLTAARRGGDALLIDLDTCGGGIELIVGCESESGLRWPDVASTKGRVSADALRAALPTREGLAVLSWRQSDQASLDHDAVRVILTAAQRGCDVVIADLPRRLDPAATVAALAADTILLVATSDVGSTAAGGRLLPSLASLCADVRLVVRRLPGAAVEPDPVASCLGVPLAATVPTRRGVWRSIEQGLGPLAGGRLSPICSRLLNELGVGRRRVA
jgi:secretion/DNA translocation related CpaE-like protein